MSMSESEVNFIIHIIKYLPFGSEPPKTISDYKILCQIITIFCVGEVRTSNKALQYITGHNV